MKTDSFAQALKFASLAGAYSTLAGAEPEHAEGCLRLAKNRRALAQGFLDTWLEDGHASDSLDLDIMWLGGAPAPTDRDVV